MENKEQLEKFASVLLRDKKIFKEYLNVLEKTIIKCIEMEIRESKKEQNNGNKGTED